MRLVNESSVVKKATPPPPTWRLWPGRCSAPGLWSRCAFSGPPWSSAVRSAPSPASPSHAASLCLSAQKDMKHWTLSSPQQTSDTHSMTHKWLTVTFDATLNTIMSNMDQPNILCTFYICIILYKMITRCNYHFLSLLWQENHPA